MSSQEPQLEQTPDFKPKLPFPPEWLALKSDDEKWMLEKQSVLEQQGEHMMRQNILIMRQLRESNDRQDRHEAEDKLEVEDMRNQLGDMRGKILSYEALRTKMSGGQLVIMWILRGLAALGMAAFAGWAAAWFLKTIK